MAGLASLGVGMYSLTKSFEYTQNKEILYSIRKDVEYLRRIESEIDENINSLLHENYEVAIEFGEPFDMIEVMSESPSEDQEEMTPRQKQIMSQMMGIAVPILKLEAPREFLVVDAWEVGFPETSNIEFDLLKQINDYYRSVKRVNTTVERLMDMGQGRTVSQGFAETLKVHAKTHNDVVDDLKSRNFVSLKNKISEEKARLTKIRNRLVEEAGNF